MFASACIGASHLVQSTRAGALAGFGLLWAILAANAAKYPFFEFGSRYASASGQSLIEGFRTLGRGASWLYLGLTLGDAVRVALPLLRPHHWPLPVLSPPRPHRLRRLHRSQTLLELVLHFLQRLHLQPSR